MKKITAVGAFVALSMISVLTLAGNRATVIIPGDHFPASFRMDPRVGEGDYLPKTIIFKVRKEYRQNCKVNSIDNILRLQDMLDAVGAQTLRKIYPNHRAPEREFNELGMKLVDISLIYSFKYTTDQSLEKVINQFLSTGYFEFVEPWYVPKLMYVPNDPSYIANQYHLQGDVVGSIDTQGAWTIQKGNSSVVIGIVDTGTEKNHPDLAANYAGGFDVAMNDSDPEWQGLSHGVLTSGDACEVTDNGTGGAGPAFNCKFKAVKIGDATGILIAAYEGIVWAADNGCKIINCSFGGAGGGTYGQTIIDYAAINKNCAVFASAGNNLIEEFLYPSSYNNAYRVVATTNSDTKSGFSSYGLDADFAAPGSGIWSTTSGSGYGASDGTSMSCPVACGVAGLVQSEFNYTSAFQIGERLKQTCDPFGGTSTSSTQQLFNAGKIGKGRIDAARAVNTSLSAKSIVMNPINITDGNDNFFMPGETLTLSGSFINYLDPSSASAAAALTIVSGPGGVISGSCPVGAMATLATQPASTPFTVTIQAGAAINSVIKFKLTITDGSFTGTQYFEVTVNPDYVNVVENDVHTSITSKGRIGFNLDNTMQGLGFEYMIPSPSVQTLYEMSLMIGSSPAKVSDMFREAGAGNTDFGTKVRAYQVTPATFSDFDLDGKFNDSAAPSPISVQVHHNAYAWSANPYRRFVIVKYVIKNTGGAVLDSTAVGIIADFDVKNSATNKAAYDAINQMSYAYDVTPGGVYAGIKLLGCTNSAGSPIGTANGYILDLASGGNGGVDASTDYTSAEKYTSLTTGRAADGFGPAGGDVMALTSSRGISIPAGDSITIAFALIAGDNLGDIRTSACAAQSKYDGGCSVGAVNEETDNFWMYNYPNPASGTFNIDYKVNGNEVTSIRIIDMLGHTIKTFDNLPRGKNTLTVDGSKFAAGSYFYQLKAGEAVLTKKLTIVK